MKSTQIKKFRIKYATKHCIDNVLDAQTECARLVEVTARTWQRWEENKHKIPPLAARVIKEHKF